MAGVRSTLPSRQVSPIELLIPVAKLCDVATARVLGFLVVNFAVVVEG